MKIRAAVLVWALAAVAGAQTTIRPGGGGGSSTITAGTTATSGCTDLSVLSSNGSKVVCPGWAKQATSGAFTIGSSSLGTSVVPLTVTPGTGSTANIQNWTNSAGTTLAYMNSIGALYVQGLGFTAGPTLGADATRIALAFGNNYHVFSAASYQVARDIAIGWTSDPNTAFGVSADAFFMREAAATVQLGADVNGAAVNQTFKAHDGITGTDISGAGLTLASGNGTGAGNGAFVALNRTNALATGTTAQTASNAVVVCESKILSNTTATTTALATIGLASGTAGGAFATITVTATDGTDFASDTQNVNLSFVNKAGTFTISTPTISTASPAASLGLTTIGFTATGASSLISLNVTPVFTTITPTTVRAYIEVHNHSAGAVVCK